MFNLIRKAFIKDYKHVNDKVVREKHGIVASLGGIIINVVLFIIKIIIGAITFSRSIISDAFNNLTDLVSNTVSLVGFKLTSKPADKKHPYGYERIEYITGLIVSLIIIALAFILGYNSIVALVTKDTKVKFTIIAFIILGISIVGKIIQGLFYYSMGKAIDSVSLKANMQDSFNDAISTTVVLISALVTYYFPNFWWLDAATSILVAIFILYSGIRLVRETTSPLIGATPDEDYINKILDTVRSFDGVLGIHDVIVHSYGKTKVFMTLHVEVDGYVDIMESHDLIDNIEAEVNKKYGVELTIHMDPLDVRSKKIQKLKVKIREALDELRLNISFYDLRLIEGPTHTTLIFDIAAPIGEKVDKNMIVKHLKKSMKALENNYKFIVKIDNTYIH